MSVRKRKGTDKWCHDYIDGSGKRHQKHYDTKGEAKEAEAKVRMELKGNFHVADPATVTVKQAGESWIAACGLRRLEASTVAQYKGHWPAAGFVDTEIRCLTELESWNAETEVQPRVQA